MKLPDVGDRVIFDGREYVVVEVNSESESVSLLPAEEVLQDIPLQNLRPITDSVN